MLLHSKMNSSPYLSRHSLTYMKDIQKLFKNQTQNSFMTFSTHSPTTGLQYFNMRVTQRLRRYRSMKKNWQEIATSIQNISSLSSACESPIPLPDILPITHNTIKNLNIQTQKSYIEPKAYCINDYINSTVAVKDNHDKYTIELDPLHSRIQQDLIKLRKLIKTKQRKFVDNPSLKTSSNNKLSGETTLIGTGFDDHENNNITISKKPASLNKLKPLDRVKIAGNQMQPQTLPKSDSADSGLGSISNSSSTCSQYSKQQQQQQQQQKSKQKNNNKTFNIYHSRVNPPPPLPSDSFIYRSSNLSRKKSNTSSKMPQNIPLKQPSSSRLPTPIIEKKQPSFTKQETLLPPIQRLSNNEDIATHLYTYSASSSSITPHSMMVKRNTSLLPILLQSSSCIGMQPREICSKKSQFNLDEEHEEEEKEEEENDDNNDYYHLLDYKHLINGLPKPVISIRPHHGQDDYGILFEQLDHIRETMPDSNIYDEYARII